MDRGKYASAVGVAKGAYILADALGWKPDLILMATGSEVSLCISAYEIPDRGRSQGPCGQYAFMGNFRDINLQNIVRVFCRQAVTARISVEQARPWLVAICWPCRKKSGHENIWSIGSAQGIAEKIRVHSGGGSGRRP